jgi:predicted AAA+ superfamily ATPase
MAITNAERVKRGLDLMREGLVPYVENELKSEYARNWIEKAREPFKTSQKVSVNEDPLRWDTYALLKVMQSHWRLVFSRTLGKTDRSLVIELENIRNRVAHDENVSTEDALRALDSAERLLKAVSATQAPEVQRLRQELLRSYFSEQERSERRRTTAVAIEGTPAEGLRPWRELITPHPDVASGRFQQAEFAADLAQVFRGEGEDEYRDPTEFFARTFITEGLRELLTNANKRLSGNGGDPVIELQTNFGGGKTHSMLALYHLFSGLTPANLPGSEIVLEDSKQRQLPKARRAVLVGTAISPGEPRKKKDGTVVNTMWGELAWQLLGEEGYAMVAEADKNGVSPGSELLIQLFDRCPSTLVLIDEWVAYLRQFREGTQLSGGTLESNLTFVQSLTEAAKATRKKDAMVVASLPSSDIEIGGEYGFRVLDRLKNVFQRVESPWRPASAEESFEIVRRRLFQPMENEKYPLRDTVIKAYARMYREQADEFPSACREKDYERRLENSYPIHPELFDRLYQDWSSMDKFQRTRGVLRIMASVIHVLWERNDASLTIMPSSIPLDDHRVQSLLTNYLDDPWVPVIERDIDGPSSLTLRIDGDNPNFGRYSAARRVARTLFMGSAATEHSSSRGLEDRLIKLGCVQPGESVATFGDVLRRLTDQSYHLYVDGRRHWYSTQQTVTRLAQDRAQQFDRDVVLEEIEKRIRSNQTKERGDFARVHACPEATSDVLDDRETRLVILRPEQCHTRDDSVSPARQVCETMLDKHGNGPRQYRNTLVFAAADKARLADLEDITRQYLAWKSINDEKKELNLDNFQQTQSDTKCRETNQTVDHRILETYQWALVPVQNGAKADLEWQQVRVTGSDPVAQKIAKKLRNDETIIAQLAGVRLKMDLEKIPLWRGNHVSVSQLIEDFAQYTYLPKLTRPRVLCDAIEDGVNLLTWPHDSFAYAEAWNEDENRYSGLKAGSGVSVPEQGSAVVVKADVAQEQLEREAAAVPASSTTAGAPAVNNGAAPVPYGKEPAEPVQTELALPRRFHASVEIDPSRPIPNFGKIAEEVVPHLTGILGSNVSITVEINAEARDGYPENIVRTVSENCRTLKFKDHGFERE